MSNRLLSAYRWSFIVQRVFLLSPIRYNNLDNTLATTYWTSTCSFIVFIIYLILSCLYVLKLNNEPSKYFTSNGFVWFITSTGDYILSKIMVIFVFIIAERKKHQQIKFFSILSRLDDILRMQFNLHNEFAYYHRTNIIAMACIIVLHIVMTSEVGNRISDYDNIQAIRLIPVVVPFYWENCICWLTVLMFINAATMLRNRYSIIRTLASCNEPHILSNRKTLIFAYIELFQLIDILNDYIGWILLIRLAHDFTLSSSICYLMFSTIMDNNANVSNMVNMFCWFLMTMARIVLVTVFAEIVLAEVLCLSFKKKFQQQLYNTGAVK